MFYKSLFTLAAASLALGGASVFSERLGVWTGCFENGFHEHGLPRAQNFQRGLSTTDAIFYGAGQVTGATAGRFSVAREHTRQDYRVAVADAEAEDEYRLRAAFATTFKDAAYGLLDTQAVVVIPQTLARDRLYQQTVREALRHDGVNTVSCATPHPSQAACFYKTLAGNAMYREMPALNAL